MVGIGPGPHADMTLRARAALATSDLVIGYKGYLELIKDLLGDKPVVCSGMGEEAGRCMVALEEASKGKTVSIVSSGDPGVYGMAGLVLELRAAMGKDIPVEVIPGVTASCAASALLGAPLAHDHAVISLSDLLTPWETIENRLRLATQADFVIVLYNPKSSQRTWQIERARDIILEYQSPSLPVGIVREAGRPAQSISITTLGKMLEQKIDMGTIIIVGNSTTFVSGRFLVTKRGYKICSW